MAQITTAQLRVEVEQALEDGLSNSEMAITFNEKFNATDKNKLTAADIAYYKEVVGLKGAKPKRKKLFEIVDATTETEELNVPQEADEPEYITEEEPTDFNY